LSQTQTISDVGRVYLRLHLASGLGPIILRRLLDRFGCAEAILSASRDELREVNGIGRTIARAIREAASADGVEQEVERAAACGVRIMCPEDAEYPPLLKHAPDGPVCLYVRGRLAKQDSVSLAIVGSRKPTYYGQEQARQFAEGLARLGLTIVSGLAYGVDACAHQGALVGEGRTIAVLGNGLADVYPPAHKDLADRIAGSGAIVSELPMETAPDSGNFPRRNRLIAGMTLGTLVIEGGQRSGAMITARLASDYNREVFALPGRCDSPMSCGPNTLIREGMGRLVTTVGDVLDGLGEVGRILRPEAAAGPSADGKSPAQTVATLTENERRTLEVLGLDPMPIEMIVDAADLSAPETAAALTTLQLKRLVKQLPGNVFVPIVREHLG
jgi:DNA processing protein